MTKLYTYHFSDGSSIDLNEVYSSRRDCNNAVHADDIAYLIKVVQEKDATIEKLEREVKGKQERIDTAESIIKQYQRQIAKLKNELDFANDNLKSTITALEKSRDQVRRRNIQIKNRDERLETTEINLHNQRIQVARRDNFIRYFLNWVSGFQFEGWYPRLVVKAAEDQLNS